jgi:hypothetical protein
MLRVVFDTRIDVNGSLVAARLDQRICPQDLDIENGIIAGRPVVRLVSIEEIKNEVCRPLTRRRMVVRSDAWRQLHSQISRRMASSKYSLLFEDALCQLERDMEWDAVVRRAGFRGVPFWELWKKFKDSCLKVFWFSPNTRNMIKRVERESWLAPLIEPKE